YRSYRARILAHYADLIAGSARAARCRDVLADRFTQPLKAGRFTVIELRDGDGSETSTHQLRPQAMRKEIERGRAEPKRPRRSGQASRRRGCRRQGRAAPRQRWMLRPDHATGRADARQIIRHDLSDER